MPTDLTLARHLDGLRAAVVAFARYADDAGPEAPVPTTPDWTVRQLLAHQGMVHRWAASVLRGRGADPDELQEAGRAAPDPVEWLRDGAVELAEALHHAPEDLDAVVFLADAPPAKRFWARRQCHETTMHSVDALSAVLGRLPRAAEADIAPEIALDGIDELLRGFLPRPKSRLRCEEPFVIAVRPEGTERSWVVEVGTGPPVTTCVPAEPSAPGRADLPSPDVVVAGSPVAIYLSLWNRSDEVDVSDCWRDGSAVTWG